MELLIRQEQKIHFKREIDFLNGVPGSEKTNLVTQLKLFLDNGLIRCRGRIDEANVPWEAKNPILLPSGSHLTDLFILDGHERVGHLGVGSVLGYLRQTVWIPKMKQKIKKVLRRCIRCRKIQGRSYATPVEPQLPRFRVQECRPFSVCGMDYMRSSLECKRST